METVKTRGQQSPECTGGDVEAMLRDGGRATGGTRGGGYAEVGAPPGESRAFGVVWLAVAFLTFPTLIFVSGAYHPSFAYVSGVFRGGQSEQHRHVAADDAGGGEAAFHGPRDVPGDKHLGGLLPDEDSFADKSCLSRFQSTMYRRAPSPHRPSPYLVERLRRYEALHRRCGPHTAAYNRTLPLLKWGGPPGAAGGGGAAECKYLVWTPYNGLGNNILTMASSFLYALLNDRVMLIDSGKDLAGLFCEPFPGSSWLAPPDFPISDFRVFEWKNNQSYGNMLRHHNISYADGAAAAVGPPPTFVYAHLNHDYDDYDKRFFCEPDQAVLAAVPWMALKSDYYFAPALFLNRRFEPELSRLFPVKETVFHHVGRYLFHPSDGVWGMITRYYQSYLARDGQILGVQIRVFNHRDAPFDLVAEQVVNCTLGQALLPAVVGPGRGAAGADRNGTTAVLVASLYSDFSDRIRDMYWEHPAAGGAVVSVHQPSHEEAQLTGRERHDLKVWAEMYLLSLADALVTSAWSTFGYIAQGLGGIRPWVLVRPYGGRMPEPACVRDVSMEPCFHTPPWYDCRDCTGFTDPGRVAPYVTHCRDVPDGIKLVDGS